MSADDLKRQRETLERVEKTTGPSGAVPRTPKAKMLDNTEWEKKNPDKKGRWVNIMDPQKAAARQMDGYTRVAESDGGRQLGTELAWFSTSRENYDARVEENKQRNRERLESHKTDVRQEIESVAKYMRDRHGVKIDVNRLMVNEER